MNDMRQTALRLAGQADLLDIRMVESSFRHIEFPGEGQITYHLHISPGAQLSEPEQRLVTSADFNLDIGQDVDGETNEIASIKFKLAGLYALTESSDFTEEEVTAFAETTGVFALYPYAREYVQDVTGRLGLPPLTLGLYKIPTGKEL